MGPNTGDKQAAAQRLAAMLLGTDALPPAHVADDEELSQHLNELVMLCVTCGRWTEVEHLDDDCNCPECVQ